MLTPKVTNVDVPATTLVGMSGQFIGGLGPDWNAHDVIPHLWQRLMESADLHDADWSIGVMNDVEGSSKMNYLAAIRLEDNGGRSDGLETLELPGGSYLACEHVGLLDGLRDTTVWFYTRYLPSSGVALRDGYHLEIYDERFDPESSDSVMLICVPV
jgi:predicted transcriptional regulator YdeE